MTNVQLAAVAAVLAAVVALPTSAQAAADGQTWVWPLQPTPSIAAAFAPPDEAWHPGHRGVDLLGTAGQSVLAIGAGQVTFAGPLAGRGVVVVDHGALRSTYEPVTAHFAVGDQVEAGEPVGVLQTVGSHCAPEVCLHLGVKRGDVYLDPLDLLPARQVRLKPLDGQLSTWDPTRAPPRADPSSTVRSPAPSSSDEAAQALSARSVLGGAAAMTAAWLVAERRRRPQARG